MSGSLYPPIIPTGTKPTPEYVRSWYQHLVSIFGQRNGEYRILRSIFDGSYNGTAIPNTPSQGLNAVTGAQQGRPFNDRMRIIYNVANATVRRYMDSMSSPPQIEGVPEGFSVEHIELADKRAKFCESVWAENDMDMKLLQCAYYQSLLDKAVFSVRPHPGMKFGIKIDLGVPDYYMPITRGDDWQHPLAVVYGFRSYENADFMRNPMVFNGDPVFNTIIEYWDYEWFVRLENGKDPLTIRHGWGFLPWYDVHNLPIPGRFRGQGDVDQAVGLNEYLNVLMSSMADMLAYAANPIAVVRGTKVGGTNLPFEPRAVWELERDAQVGFLQWTGAPPSFEAQILRTIQAIEDTTGVSSPAFGREIPSGTSGQAVRSLLAGFNTRLGTKQQMLGNALVKMNEGILRIAEQTMPNKEFRIMGEKIHEGSVRKGANTYYTVKPIEFNGWYKNRVVFLPTDPATNYFQAVDKFKVGLASKYDTLKALGVKDVWDTLERIRIEKEEEAVHQNNLALAAQGKFVNGTMQAQTDAGHMDKIGSLIQSLKQGQSDGQPAGPGLTAGAAPDANADRKGKRDLAVAVAKPQPGGITQPGATGGTSEPSSLPDPDLKINDVLAKLRLATNLTGRAAVVGDLVTNAKAGKGVIALDNLADANAIRAALGGDASRFSFQQIDRFKPLPQNAAIFSQGGDQKKNQPASIRRPQGRELNVAVLNKKETSNAVTYQLGVTAGDGRIVPVGWTDPARGFDIEPGEVIRVKIGSISQRFENGHTFYGISKTVPIKAPPPAAPDSTAMLAAIYKETPQ